MYSTGRKMGFVGMIISLNSIISIFEDHVISNEQIFSRPSWNFLVRSRVSYINNPTARQFESAYKHILIHCELTSSQNANCLNQSPISILTVSSSHKDQIILSGRYSIFRWQFQWRKRYFY